MKKIILAPLAALALTSLVGCGGSNTDYNDNTRLIMRVHVDSGSEEGIGYTKIITEFNRENNGKIRVDLQFVARSGGVYEEQLDNDKRKNTLPDVFTFDAPKCAYYAKYGYFYDLSSSFAGEEDNFVALNKYQGRLYGIPVQESSAGFYYNKNLFAQAGIDVSGVTWEHPWTFTQFEEACAKLKNIGKTPVDMRLDATEDETATYLLYPFIYSCGGSFVDSTGLHAYTNTAKYFNSDNSKKGYSFFKSLVSKGYTTYSLGAQDFFVGKVGMYLSSGWTIPELDRKWPEYFPNRDSWGLLPYPKADDGVAVSCNGSWSYAIGNNPRTDKSNVVTLLKYLTNKKSSETITQHTGMIPATKAAQQTYPANSPEDVLMKQLNNTSVQRPETVGYAQFSNAFCRVIKDLKTDTVEEAVESAALYLERELSRIK